MKIGLGSPNSTYGPSPAAMAVDAEQRGYDSLWVGEHPHIPANRVTPHFVTGMDLPKAYLHFRDMFVSLAMASAVTTELKLATGVCLVLEHEIIDLANSVATLDNLSDGRVLFGIGVGWNVEELANVSDVPWSQRYNAMRESVAALRALWTEEAAGFEGDHVRFEPAWVNPKPVQSGGPPVVMGCQGPLGMGHVAQYADQWCPLDWGTGGLEPNIAAFGQAMETASRDPDSVALSVFSFAKPEAELFEKYRDLGLHRVVVFSHDSVDGHQRFMDRLQPFVDEFAD